MRVAAHHANGKVRGKTIVDTEGYAPGREIKPARVVSTVDVSEFTNSRDKYAPPVFRCRLHHGRTALAFCSAWPRKAQIKVTSPRIDRETGRAEASAAGTNTIHPPLQIICLNIGRRNAETEHRCQLFRRDQVEIMREVAQRLAVEEID